MKTVQLTIDEELLSQVDRISKKLRTTRSAFTRGALRAALLHLREIGLERKHRDGYQRHPVRREELGLWEKEQVWPSR
jgi:metal-responsive CopG/Arc/MetJ family transcriptional regulator